MYLGGVRGCGPCSFTAVFSSTAWVYRMHPFPRGCTLGCFAVRNECPSTSPVRPQVPMSRGLQDVHRGGELAGGRASVPADGQTVCPVVVRSSCTGCACVGSRSPRRSALGAVRLQRRVRTPLAGGDEAHCFPIVSRA